MPEIYIEQVLTASAWEDARSLVQAYVLSLKVDLSFQEIDKELADLPQLYSVEKAGFFLAFLDGKLAGCGGIKPFNEHDAELKRLYILPKMRGHGIAKRLTEHCLSFARTKGFQRVLLDSLPDMKEAQALYKAIGFVDIPPYRFNPVANTVFMSYLL